MTAIAIAESSEQKPVFVRGQKWNIPVPGPEGDRICVVRFPTDEEWCARTRRVTVVRRNLGRDATQAEQVHQLDAAKELLDRILMDGEPSDWDEFEALSVVSELEKVELLPNEIERRGNVWVIPMIALGINVIHRLRVPTQKQIFEHDKAALHMTGRKYGQDFKHALEPFGELWDRIQDGVEGYADIGAVSIIHKHAAVQEVLEQVRQRIQSGIAPER